MLGEEGSRTEKYDALSFWGPSSAYLASTLRSKVLTNGLVSVPKKNTKNLSYAFMCEFTLAALCVQPYLKSLHWRHCPFKPRTWTPSQTFVLKLFSAQGRLWLYLYQEKA